MSLSEGCYTISDTNWPEFCLVLSKDATINPSPDCHVFSFHDIETQKWADFNQKRNALFAKIKADITH